MRLRIEDVATLDDLTSAVVREQEMARMAVTSMLTATAVSAFGCDRLGFGTDQI